jgi:hypothetical protein
LKIIKNNNLLKQRINNFKEIFDKLILDNIKKYSNITSVRYEDNKNILSIYLTFDNSNILMYQVNIYDFSFNSQKIIRKG